jgi:hypothetical protein
MSVTKPTGHMQCSVSLGVCLGHLRTPAAAAAAAAGGGGGVNGRCGGIVPSSSGAAAAAAAAAAVLVEVHSGSSWDSTNMSSAAQTRTQRQN